MGDEHYGDPEAAVDVDKQRQHRLRGLRIQGTCRLVTEQVARIGGQGAGDAHSLLLPPRQLGGKGAAVLAKPHQFQQLADPGNPLPARHSGDFQRDCHVLLHAAGVQQIEVLENHAGPLTVAAQGRPLQGRDVAAIEQDAAPAWPLQQIEATNERALACAAAPENAVDGPIRNLERHSLQSGLPVPRVLLAEPLQHYHDCRPATGITDPL